VSTSCLQCLESGRSQDMPAFSSARYFQDKAIKEAWAPARCLAWPRILTVNEIALPFQLARKSDRVRRGQYLTADLPVLSAGPTPEVGVKTWSFRFTTVKRSLPNGAGPSSTLRRIACFSGSAGQQQWIDTVSISMLTVHVE
jgi:hypothetical protein